MKESIYQATTLYNFRPVFIVEKRKKEKRFQNTLENMESTELSIALRRFFVEARKVEGKPYSRNTIKTNLVGLDWFLSCSPRRPQRKTFSIIRDK